MVKANLILIGAGGHALSCIDVIEQESRYKIAGLVGLATEVGLKQHGYMVLATDLELTKLVMKYSYALIAVGQINTAANRVRLYENAVGVGFKLATVVAPTAYISPKATIGHGTVIMQGVIVNAGATIGNNCIINSNSLVEHNANVGDHCHISTGAILNGSTIIGSGSFIGSGAIVKEGISIGEKSLIGMGTLVRHDIDSNSKFLG
jgi:sugar O-acyltransferase (sialic acid O-acetyltransferase NeuD family)